MTTQEAIHDALGRCIRRNVFTEFLVECGQEIEPILAEALDQSCALDQVREEAREEAATRGYTEAQAQAYEAGYMEGRVTDFVEVKLDYLVRAAGRMRYTTSSEGWVASFLHLPVCGIRTMVRYQDLHDADPEVAAMQGVMQPQAISEAAHTGGVERGMSAQEAIRLTIDECIKEGVYDEFLQEHGREVEPMLVAKFDERYTVGQLWDEGHEITKGGDQGLFAIDDIEDDMEDTYVEARLMGFVLAHLQQLELAAQLVRAKVLSEAQAEEILHLPHDTIHTMVCFQGDQDSTIRAFVKRHAAALAKGQGPITEYGPRADMIGHWMFRDAIAECREGWRAEYLRTYGQQTEQMLVTNFNESYPLTEMQERAFVQCTFMNNRPVFATTLSHACP